MDYLKCKNKKCNRSFLPERHQEYCSPKCRTDANYQRQKEKQYEMLDVSDRRDKRRKRANGN